MVVVAAACRLGPYGKELQARVAALIREGKQREATAAMAQALAPRPLRYPARGLGWVVGRAMTRDDPSDMLVTIDAEDSFDVESGLGRVQASTLVMGGSADRFYSADLFRRTAAGIPDGRGVVMPGRSHLYLATSKTVAGIALGYLLG